MLLTRSSAIPRGGTQAQPHPVELSVLTDDSVLHVALEQARDRPIGFVQVLTLGGPIAASRDSRP